MGKLHRARVVAVGSQQDMLRMVRAMLDNGDWLHEEEEYAPPETLQRRLEQVARHARWEGGEFCGFLAEMIAMQSFAKREYLVIDKVGIDDQPVGLRVEA